jgi:hypothetical protein
MATTTAKQGGKAPASKKTEDLITITRSEQQQLQRMGAKVTEIGSLMLADEKAREKSKAAKANLEEARGALFDMVRDLNTPKPLLDHMESDGWKKMPLSEITGIGTALADRLVEGSNGVIKARTLGALAAFTADHKLTDIAGIGQGQAKKIEDALMDFWKRNPQFCQDKVGTKGAPRKTRASR